MKNLIILFYFIFHFIPLFAQVNKGIEIQLIPIDTANRIYKIKQTRFRRCQNLPSSCAPGYCGAMAVYIKTLDNSKPFLSNHFSSFGLPSLPYWDSAIIRLEGQSPSYEIPTTCPNSPTKCIQVFNKPNGIRYMEFENIIQFPKTCDKYLIFSDGVNFGDFYSNVFKPFTIPWLSYSIELKIDFSKGSNTTSICAENILSNVNCLNKKNKINFQTQDAEGDSLVYILDTTYLTPYIAFPSPSHFPWSYRVPTTPTHPTFDCGYNYNASTATYKFYPDTIQQSVYTLKILEYRKGQFIGHSTRQLVFDVMNNGSCINVPFQSVYTPSCTLLKDSDMALTRARAAGTAC